MTRRPRSAVRPPRRGSPRPRAVRGAGGRAAVAGAGLPAGHEGEQHVRHRGRGASAHPAQLAPPRSVRTAEGAPLRRTGRRRAARRLAGLHADPPRRRLDRHGRLRARRRLGGRDRRAALAPRRPARRRGPHHRRPADLPARAVRDRRGGAGRPHRPGRHRAGPGGARGRQRRRTDRALRRPVAPRRGDRRGGDRAHRARARPDLGEPADPRRAAHRPVARHARADVFSRSTGAAPSTSATPS